MADQSHGMEYTLQGVMRFLQVEWHNHERARNAWDIERAEMKAKIAKQEGDYRSSKKLNESLDRRIRMLERAVKHERAKNKAIAVGEKHATEEQAKKEWDSQTGTKPPRKTQRISASDDQPEQQGLDQDSRRDIAKLYCQKNVEELTYLVAPTTLALAVPPDVQQPQSAVFSNHHDPRHAMEDVYVQQQQQVQALPIQRQRQVPSLGPPQLPSIPNQHPPPVRASSDYHNLSYTSQHPSQALSATRQPLVHQIPQQQSQPTVNQDGSTHMISSPQDVESSIERVSHRFDEFGRPTQLKDDPAEYSRTTISEDPDGWDFDDATTVLETRPEIAPPRVGDADLFPLPNTMPAKSPPRLSPSQRRRSSGSVAMARRRSSDGSHEVRDLSSSAISDPPPFKVRFALRGHLDVIRSVIFTGGGSPSEPELCTAGDDSCIKRWIIPSSYSTFPPGAPQAQSQSQGLDLDIQSYFTHRGHEGTVTCLAACPSSAPSFSTGGRAAGDGWVFSGGEDATIRVWERGRVDPKATLDGHTDAIWALCVLANTSASIFGHQDPNIPSDSILLASASADNSVKIWAVSAPPQLTSPQNAPGATSRRGVGGSRRHSITSGSGFPSSPQPSTASGTPFHYTLVHSIETFDHASPTCIAPLGPIGDTFAVGFADSSVLVFDTRTGEEVVGMASNETYDGTPATGINSIVVTNAGTSGPGLDGTNNIISMGMDNEEEGMVHGATGSSKSGGVEGVVITGHEDRFVRFFDANSGQCTYSMLAHTSSIASLALSPDGRELVTAGHDASLRFWSLEKRSCVQEISSFRSMRGEGAVSVVWSGDGRWVVAGGGDGGGRVFGR